jgi:O-succinylbenzoate synthase
LGHKETLAYTKWDEMETYVADDSTQEFFGNEDVKELDLPTYYKTEEKFSDDYFWLEYSEEDTSNNSKLEFAVPTTETKILMQLKQKALEKLLENSRAEFCYGDPRVNNYKKDYLILGEKVIDKIYKDYMAWLKDNCTTYAQDSSSGEFTGIAINWQGKEDLQPNFDIYLN